VWEAALSAGKHRLDTLTVLIDYNKFQSYGPRRDIQDLEPYAEKWRSFGFAVREVDGHDVAALRVTLTELPVEAGRPSAIICHTVKGKGLATTENNPEWHHKSRIDPAELAGLYAELNAPR
jgi:transketolase